MLQHVDHVDLVARLELAEIDDDVVALGDTQCGQFPIFEVDGVLHDVAVVGDHVERYGITQFIHQRELEVA